MENKMCLLPPLRFERAATKLDLTLQAGISSRALRLLKNAIRVYTNFLGNACDAGRMDQRKMKLPERTKKVGAVERTRTFTVLLPPAPQAGASANSATTAKAKRCSIDSLPRSGSPAEETGWPFRYCLSLLPIRH